MGEERAKAMGIGNGTAKGDLDTGCPAYLLLTIHTDSINMLVFTNYKNYLASLISLEF